LLKYRIISGCLIGAVLVLVANYLPAFGILLLLVAISSFAQLEFYAMINHAGIPSFRILGVVCGAAYITASFFTVGGEASVSAYQWENFVLAGSLIAVFVRQFPQKNNPKPLETIACTLLGIWYVPYLLNFFTRLVFLPHGETPTCLRIGESGRILALYLVVVVKCGDIGAYTVGRLIGRHKLFPRISPAKTWEGLFGGIVFSVVASCWFSLAGCAGVGGIALNLTHAVLLGALLSVVGVVGDMFESLLKRAAGAKDSSAVIPGMGGILDVLDSLLFGAPVLYVYVKAVLS
jgi:phosphatidate cytidylyltransferase